MLKHVVLAVSIAMVCAAGAQAVTVLEQNFDNMALGPITTDTQDYAGDPYSTGGAWRFRGGTQGQLYPAVTDAAAHSGTQSYVIARGSTTGKASVAWTSSVGYADDQSGNTYGAAAGQSFSCTAYINPISYGGGMQGSWTINPNNYDYCQSYTPVMLYADPYGNLLAYGVREYDNRLLWFDTGKDIAAGAWTGIKMTVTSWDDGTGLGSYDAYINTGSGFVLAMGGIRFHSNELFGKINAIEIDPSYDDGKLCGYMDDVSITYVPEPVTMTLLGLGGLFLARRRA